MQFIHANDRRRLYSNNITWLHLASIQISLFCNNLFISWLQKQPALLDTTIILNMYKHKRYFLESVTLGRKHALITRVFVFDPVTSVRFAAGTGLATPDWRKLAAAHFSTSPWESTLFTLKIQGCGKKKDLQYHDTQQPSTSLTALVSTFCGTAM